MSTAAWTTVFFLVLPTILIIAAVVPGVRAQRGGPRRSRRLSESDPQSAFRKVPQLPPMPFPPELYLPPDDAQDVRQHGSTRRQRDEA